VASGFHLSSMTCVWGELMVHVEVQGTGTAAVSCLLRRLAEKFSSRNPARNPALSLVKNPPKSALPPVPAGSSCLNWDNNDPGKRHKSTSVNASRERRVAWPREGPTGPWPGGCKRPSMDPLYRPAFHCTILYRIMTTPTTCCRAYKQQL
jgi:hypothetical protein